ncbi:MAG: TRAP transporter small permease [Pseudomonadota bacterium]
MSSKLITWLPDRLTDVASLLLVLMMLNITLDVILKALFNAPIQGTLEVTAYYYMVGSVLLPIAIVELTRSPISADVFFNLMPFGLRFTLMAFILALCVVAYAGLAWITWSDAMRAFGRNEVSMGGVGMPIWPSRFILPVSFAMGALACAWNLLLLLTSPDARADLVADATEQLINEEIE